jgi:hypothetical protein
MNAVVQAMTAGLDRRINTSPSGAEQSSQRGIDKAPSVAALGHLEPHDDALSPRCSVAKER